MTPTAFDQLTSDEPVAHLPARPELSNEELHAFHWQARTIATRAREFFPDSSFHCGSGAKPLPGTLAAFMQENAPA